MNVLHAPTTHEIEEIVNLELVHLNEVCALEKRCYSNPWSEQLLSAEFSKRISFRPGIFSSGQLVAYCFNHLVVDEIHILNLAVKPEDRRRGLGRRLLKHTLACAASRGARYATLEVRQSNGPAKALYQTFGFYPVELRKAYYRDNSEDALVLERTLP